MCHALEDIFGKTSVVDFGAGLGPYGRCLLKRKDQVFFLKDLEKSTKLNDLFLSEMGEEINKSQVIYSWDGKYTLNI